MSEGGSDDEDKTEEPSARRLEQALEKGQVFNSKDFVTFAVTSAAALSFAGIFPGKVPEYLQMLRGFFLEAALPFSSDRVIVLLREALFALILPFMLAVWGAAALFAAVQHPLIWTPEPMAPKAERISPLAGMKRLFSAKTAVEFLKSFLKIVLTGVAGYLAVAPYAPELLGMISAPQDASFALWKALTVRMFLGMCLVAGAIGGADYLYQRHDYYKSMRMSRHDLKQEYKETEGNPEIKSKIAQLRRERSKRRMAAAVPKADVVITNPVHYAVALQYDMEKDQAPRVVAKGKDAMALRIREIAEKHGVPVVRNPPLARALFEGTEIDTYIPEQYYRAAAEIIRYVFGLKGKLPKSGKSGGKS